MSKKPVVVVSKNVTVLTQIVGKSNNPSQLWRCTRKALKLSSFLESTDSDADPAAAKPSEISPSLSSRRRLLLLPSPEIRCSRAHVESSSVVGSSRTASEPACASLAEVTGTASPSVGRWESDLYRRARTRMRMIGRRLPVPHVIYAILSQWKAPLRPTPAAPRRLRRLQT